MRYAELLRSDAAEQVLEASLKLHSFGILILSKKKSSIMV